jgi:hypothetical protein
MSNGCESKILVIDYLNVGFYRVINAVEDNYVIYVLFRNRNALIEGIILKWLKFKKIRVFFEKINTVQTYKAHTNLADLAAREFVKANVESRVKNQYIANRIGRLFFNRIYRSCVIFEFIASHPKLHDTMKIFISDPKVETKFINHKLTSSVNFYKSYGYANDVEFQTPYRPYLQNSIIRKIRIILILLHDIFFIKLQNFSKNINVDAIFQVHPNTQDRKFLSHKKITENFKKSAFIKGNSTIEVNHKKYNYRRLSPSKLHHYIKHVWIFFSFRGSYSNLVFFDRMLILRDWINMFFLNQIFDRFQPVFFYSNYESNTALQIQTILKNHQCVSVASTFSAGYFPVEFEFSHQLKWADVFLVWGEYLSKLYLASNDKSGQHVISGYAGDFFMDEFRNYADKNYSFDKPVIAIYDSTYADDLFLTRKESIDFVSSVANYSIIRGAQVIVKTKKGGDLYDNLCEKYPTQIYLDDRPASFAASMNANLVIGYLSSTPCLIAKSYGINTVLYDPYGFIWDGGKGHLSEDIITNKEKLFYCIDSSITGDIGSVKGLKGVDPFSDGRFTQRACQYLQNLLAYSDLNKEEKIAYANKQYVDEYGDRYIIKNNF